MNFKNLLVSIVALVAVSTGMASKGAKGIDLVKVNNAELAKANKALVSDLAALRGKGLNQGDRTVKAKAILNALKASRAATGAAEAFIVHHPSMTDAAIRAASSTEGKLALDLMSELTRDLGGESRFNTNESDINMQTIGSVIEILTNGTANDAQRAFATDLIAILKKQVQPDLLLALKQAGGKYALENQKDITEWLELLCKCTGRCL